MSVCAAARRGRAPASRGSAPSSPPAASPPSCARGRSGLSPGDRAEPRVGLPAGPRLLGAPLRLEPGGRASWAGGRAGAICWLQLLKVPAHAHPTCLRCRLLRRRTPSKKQDCQPAPRSAAQGRARAFAARAQAQRRSYALAQPQAARPLGCRRVVARALLGAPPSAPRGMAGAFASSCSAASRSSACASSCAPARYSRSLQRKTRSQVQDALARAPASPTSAHVKPYGACTQARQLPGAHGGNASRGSRWVTAPPPQPRALGAGDLGAGPARQRAAPPTLEPAL